jgi:hypothetical protein
MKESRARTFGLRKRDAISREWKTQQEKTLIFILFFLPLDPSPKILLCFSISCSFSSLLSIPDDDALEF